MLRAAKMQGPKHCMVLSGRCSDIAILLLEVIKETQRTNKKKAFNDVNMGTT
jgi:hypothetical protein